MGGQNIRKVTKTPPHPLTKLLPEHKPGGSAPPPPERPLKHPWDTPGSTPLMRWTVTGKGKVREKLTGKIPSCRCDSKDGILAKVDSITSSITFLSRGDDLPSNLGLPQTQLNLLFLPGILPNMVKGEMRHPLRQIGGDDVMNYLGKAREVSLFESERAAEGVRVGKRLRNFNLAPILPNQALPG